MSVVRRGGSTASVSWSPVSPWDARGVPLYKVLYWPSFSSKAGHCGAMESELTSEPHVLLNDLREDTEYNIRVQVLTAEGTIEGPRSDSGSMFVY